MNASRIARLYLHFFPDLFDYVANYLPLHVALDRYFDPQAQGSVEDYGYIGIATLPTIALLRLIVFGPLSRCWAKLCPRMRHPILL